MDHQNGDDLHDDGGHQGDVSHPAPQDGGPLCLSGPAALGVALSGGIQDGLVMYRCLGCVPGGFEVFEAVHPALQPTDTLCHFLAHDATS